MKLTQITLRAGAALYCAILFAAPLQAKQATAKAAKPTSMFVVSGATATIQHHDGGYILKMPLNNIKQMLTFTEQPFRLVKYIKREGLKQVWNGKTVANNFAGDPPNAVLMTPQHRPAVVIIKHMSMHGPSVDFLFEPIKPGMFSVPVGTIHEVGLTIDGLSSLFKSSATKAAESAAEASKAQAGMKYVQVAGDLEKARETFETAKEDGDTDAMSDALDNWNSLWKKVQSDGDVNYSLSDDEQAALGKHGLDPTEEGGATDQLSDAQSEEWIKSLGNAKATSKNTDELFKTDDSDSEVGAIDGDDGLDDLFSSDTSSAGENVSNSLTAGETTASASGSSVVGDGAVPAVEEAAEVVSDL